MKNRFFTYLRDRVIGRPLRTAEVVYALEQGRLEGTYADCMTFSDALASAHGLQFHMTTVTEEKVYELDDSGKRAGLKKDFTGTSVFRYELAERRSTGDITGYMRCLSSTVSENTMEAVVYGVYGVRVAGDELCWKEQQLFYRDMPAEGGQFRAVAFDAAVRFYLENEKLRFEYIPSYFDVNPETMAKSPSKDRYPPFVSRED